ncbi:MAG TPA: F0F1 ATP synthase subunit epsilon [Alcanivoracaceae bacterium]|nr:F0F1 ATP synthase subunit epsilon [Alcanivoracaceae bacterium]
MAKTLHCEIVSAEEPLFSGAVKMIVATGTEGELGILPGHTPLLTGLKPGPVRVIMADDTEEVFYVNGGYLEVQPKVVTLLADAAARAKDIDEAAAEEARQRALEVIEGKQSELDYTTAATQLAESVAQLRTIRQLKKKYGAK